MMSNTTRLWYLGGDPGNNGAVAAISSEVGSVQYTTLLNDRDKLSIWLQQFDPRRCKAITEWNSSSPQMGSVSAFTFGQNCERIPMALVALGIPMKEVKPRVWQKRLGVKPRYKEKIKGLGTRHTETKDAFKRRLRDLAEELFPDLKLWGRSIIKQMAVCDALLIAEYCRREDKCNI